MAGAPRSAGDSWEPSRKQAHEGRRRGRWDDHGLWVTYRQGNKGGPKPLLTHFSQGLARSRFWEAKSACHHYVQLIQAPYTAISFRAGQEWGTSSFGITPLLASARDSSGNSV